MTFIFFKVMPVEPHPERRWVDDLSDEDLAFLKRFLLASGSLKELAAGYGVSYPTIRLRLDRMIEKVRILDSAEVMGPFERKARALCAEGRMDMAALKAILAAYREEKEAAHDDAKPGV
jgi:hypothetical protein